MPDAPRMPNDTKHKEHHMSWTIRGCLHCAWTTHTPESITHCPNDGSQTVILPDYINQWKTLAAARHLFQADGFEQDARTARSRATAERKAASVLLAAA